MWWDSTIASKIYVGNYQFVSAFLKRSSLAKCVSVMILNNELLVSLILCYSPLRGFPLQSLLVFPSQSYLSMPWCLPFCFHMCFCLGWRWTFGELGLSKAFSDALVKAPREHYFCDLSKGRLGKVWSGAWAPWRGKGNHRLQLSVSGPSVSWPVWLTLSYPCSQHCKLSFCWLSHSPPAVYQSCISS